MRKPSSSKRFGRLAFTSVYPRTGRMCLQPHRRISLALFTLDAWGGPRQHRVMVDFGKIDNVHEHLSNTLTALRAVLDHRRNDPEPNGALLAAARLLTE